MFNEISWRRVKRIHRGHFTTPGTVPSHWNHSFRSRCVIVLWAATEGWVGIRHRSTSWKSRKKAAFGGGKSRIWDGSLHLNPQLGFQLRMWNTNGTQMFSRSMRSSRRVPAQRSQILNKNQAQWWMDWIGWLDCSSWQPLSFDFMESYYHISENNDHCHHIMNPMSPDVDAFKAREDADPGLLFGVLSLLGT